MANISIRNLNKTYPGGVEVIKNLNLEIKDKEFIVLVGPSGCGKSTTLRMIAGLEEITGGELYIGDALVNHVQPKDRDIAMVFQNYALYPHMTVYKNLAFGLELRNLPKAEIDRKIIEAAKVLDLEKYLNRKPRALSGGQRQRVALGRALVRNPQVFLLDEPLSNLDAKLRTQMRTEISKLHRKLQTTFVYVTHDQTEAMTMGDRIVVMKDGLIQQVDTPENLYNKPVNKFVAGFIGSPQMNFLESKVINKTGKYYVEMAGQLIEVPPGKNRNDILAGYLDRKVTLGIRPEDLHLDQVFIEMAPRSLINLKIEITEMMGAEVYCYGKINGDEVIVRTPQRFRPQEQQHVVLAVDVNKIHLFDIDTGEALLL